MAKEKQKMTLGVRRRGPIDVPAAVDPAKLEAFASGADNAPEKLSPPKVAEQKVVRDAFTMPAEDHALFSEIQQRCLGIGMIVTKSEIVRAGLKFFSELDDANLQKTIKNVPKIKTGRPITGKSKDS